MHQILVHEVPAQSGEIPVSPSDDLVDHGLGVAASWLEIFNQPPQNSKSLLVLRRDCEKPARPIYKVLQDASVVFVRFASLQLLPHSALDSDLVEPKPLGELVQLALDRPRIPGACARFHMDHGHAQG